MSTQYILPPIATTTPYTTSLSGSSTVQLINYGVSPSVTVPFFFLASDAPKVFYDSLAQLPCLIKYKSINGAYSIFCDPQTIAAQDPTETYVQVITMPDVSITPAVGTIGANLRNLNTGLTTVTSGLASQVSKESADVASLTATVSSHTTTLSSHANSITTLNGLVSVLSSSLTTSQNRIAVLEAAILAFGLVSGSGTSYTVVSGLQNVAQVLTNKNSISTLNTNVSSLKSIVNSNATTASGNAATYNAAGVLQATQGPNKTPLMTNSAQVTAF
jgi:hypothetical protein